MQKVLQNRDFLNILILFSLLILGFTLTYAHFGNLIVDCGREAYLPSVVFDKNHVMYKDVFNLYPPLSYIINGIFYKIFGESFNILYFAGFINTGIIVLFFYLLSRLFLNETFSLSIGIFTVLYNVFGYFSSSMEFIFPYSYAYVYALSSIIISLFLFLKFIQNENKYHFLILSFLFAGISFANKFEFAFTGMIYIAFIFILKIKVPIDKILISALSYIFFPLISFGYIISTGLTSEDLINLFEFGKRFFNTEAYINFAHPDAKVHLYGIKMFIISFCGFLPLILYLKKKKEKNNFVYILLTVVGGVIFFINYKHQLVNLCWICWSSVLVMAYLGVKLLKNHSKQDVMFLITVCTFLAGALKIELFLAKNTYGIYLIPFFVFINIVFLQNYCKKISETFDLEKSLSAILISISLITFCVQTSTILNFKNYRLDTPKGVIYTYKDTGSDFEQLSKYITDNTDKNSMILALPEGIMLNWVTNRKTDLKLYHLIQIHIETLGESYILSNLTKNSPDYIVDINIKYLPDSIKQFIFTNYQEEISFKKMKLIKQKTNKKPML